MKNKNEIPNILIVDDTPENLKVLSGMLKGKGYEVRPVLSGKLALQAMKGHQPDLILLDINMPEMNGYEVCEKIKCDEKMKGIPVIFISALSETMDKVKAFSVGGVDYITKPFQFEEVNARVQTHLQLRYLMTDLENAVEEKIAEITESQIATIIAMARLAQSRDDATGTHLERVQGYCDILSNALLVHPHYKNLIEQQDIELIRNASFLHDIGKVGIPDAILLKADKLTKEEFNIMKKHTSIGASTLEAVQKYYPQNKFIEMGIQMAKWHHERWNGSGYPDGLVGEAIPLSARIMAIADVYDALKSERCYKPEIPHEVCCDFIISETNKAFDPVLVAIFKEKHEAFLEVWESNKIVQEHK